MPQASGFPCSSPSTHSHGLGGSSETWENQLETLNAMAVRSFCLKCPEWLPPTSLFPGVEAAEAEKPVAMFPQRASVYCLFLLHYPTTRF